MGEVPGDTTVRGALPSIYRQEWGRSVAYLVRLTRDLQSAEDCVQDAFESALRAWSRDGLPDNPGAWIRVTARHRFIDAARSSRSQREALARLALLTSSDVAGEIGPDMDRLVKDDELALIFLCCHPAIAPTDQVMLALRIVAGLKTREIAAAFLANEEGVRTRLLRAKRKIRGAGISTGLPAADRLNDRLESVFAAIYLIFNEGYLAARGEAATRSDLASEAVRLAARLVDLVPRSAEAHALLALVLLTDARAAARTGQPDVLIPLDEQDRSRWSHEKIAAGRRHLTTALTLATPGRYATEAAISAEHCRAARFSDTDWPAIVGLYDRLILIEDSPLYRLNRCVADSFARTPEAALVELMNLEGSGLLEGHYLLPATRGDLLRRAGRGPEASQAYRQALKLIDNQAAANFLRRRITELGNCNAPAAGDPSSDLSS